MNELRIKHKVQIELRNKSVIRGVISDYTQDRVMISIDYADTQKALELLELEELLVSVETHLGLKKMLSHVIDPMNASNMLVIENNEAIPFEQKREFVRVVSNLVFKIEKQDSSEILCSCKNISAGGVAFKTPAHFEIGEKVVIKYHCDDFEKDLEINAKIIKAFQGSYVAQYVNVKPFDEDKIVKYVFKMIAKH